MIFYTLIFCVVIFFAYMYDNFVDGKQEQARIGGPRQWAYLFLSLSLLAALSAVRYDTGYDYFYSYVPSLNEVRNGGVSHYDYLFNQYLKIFSLFESNQWFFAVTSILTVSLFYYAFLRSDNHLFAPVAIFIASYHYLRSFCFVAQYLAMSVFMVAFVLLIKGRRLVPILLIVLACLLHNSLLVVLPFFIFILLSNSILNISISIIVPAVSVLLSGLVRDLLLKYISHTRFSDYFSGQYDIGYSDKSLTYINLLILILYIIITVIISTKNIISNTCTIFLLAQSFAFSFSVLQSSIPVGYRLVWPFMLVQCISIPYMLSQVFEKQFTRMIITFVVIFFYVWMIKVPIASGASQVLPYHFFFAPEFSIY